MDHCLQKRDSSMKRVFIIAEAGVNHNGSVSIAKRMIDVASEAGADAVKFQTFKAENVISKFAPKAEYQKSTTGHSESQLDMAKKLELNEKEFKGLFDYCKERTIMFLSTPFDLDSIDLLNRLGLEIFKIPSGEITNLPYLKEIGALKKKVIMSTGMSYVREIKSALDALIKAGTRKKNITLLHCNTEYPTPYEDVNLYAMITLKKKFGVEAGYSDHTLGVEVPVAAAALGASVIEKHFTLDRNMEGPDHKASLEPVELKAMVKAIRNLEKALGSSVKKPSASESKNIAIARKSIVAARKIRRGAALTSENLTVKRPGTGINPMRWEHILGRKAKKDFQRDELIEI